jgi:hypothetical protein
MGCSQSGHAADLSATGAHLRQTEQALFSQRTARFSQRLANRGIQAGVGNGNFLRAGRNHEGGHNQNRDKGDRDPPRIESRISVRQRLNNVRLCAKNHGNEMVCG